MPTNVRDPRTIITPDAFGISPDLLGTPLARPGSRLWAMMIDLVVVGILTTMLGGVGLFVVGVGALFLIAVAFRSTPGRTTQAVSILLRVSAGCLGLTILGLMLVAWLLSGLAEDGRDEGDGPNIDLTLEQLEEAARRSGGEVGGLAAARLIGGGLSNALGLVRAADAEEAEAAAFRFLRGLEGLDLDREARLEILAEMTPSDAPWADQADAVYRRALDRWEASVGAAPTDSAAGAETARVVSSADSVALAGEVEALNEREALAAYAATLGADSAGLDPVSGLRTRLLRRRALEVLAGDTVSALADRMTSLRADLAEERARREAAERRSEQGGNALVALVRDIWEQLGSAIGLWSIYFTVTLALFGGQTVGKRVLGLRVVRLDGEPITWWSAFERAGGYVAGLATGLLGFAQVFWDPNRQCIHDKIVATVVVDDRAERIPGSWKEAWTQAPGVRSRRHGEEGRAQASKPHPGKPEEER